MTGHLNDDELRDWLLGAPTLRCDQHMAACAECRDDALRLRDALGDFRESLRVAAEGQRWQPGVQPIQEAQGWRPFAGASLGWVWTVAALVLLAAGLWLAKSHPSSQSAATPPAQKAVAATDDARDEALLLDVQEALDRAAPRALVPAGELGPELRAQQNPSFAASHHPQTRKRKGE